MAPQPLTTQLMRLSLMTLAAVFFLFSLLVPSHGHVLHFPALFQFGDSLSDTGNAKFLYDDCSIYYRPPYGMTYFKQSTGRVCDGRLIIDFLASASGHPFLSPSVQGGITNYSHGANFAAIGSTALSVNFFTARGADGIRRNVTLSTQVDWFLKFQESSRTAGRPVLVPKPEDFRRALYVIGEIGGVDYRIMVVVLCMPVRELPSITPHVLQAKEKAIKTLYKAGARYFLVFNIPALGCSPFSREYYALEERDEMGCVVLMNRVAAIHGSMLSKMVSRLREELPDSSIVIGDLFEVNREVIQNSRRYGFSEPLEPCCGVFKNGIRISCGTSAEHCEKPSEYVFWNEGHFTDAFHNTATNLFLSGRFLDPPNGLQTSKKQMWGVQ